MKVRLAAQTFSWSVSRSLELARQLNLQQFKGSEGTSKFVADVDRYICTYRLSQDHLEMFFSCVRHRGGWNNNPSAMQFRYAYRSLLVHADVTAVKTGNVAPDLEGLMTVPHQRMQRSQAEERDESSSPEASIIRAVADHDYGNLSYGLTNFSSEVVQYIGGFIVRAVAKRVTCPTCTDILVKDSITSVLIFIRKNGGLIMPSALVHHVLHTAEHVFRNNLANVRKMTIQRLVLLSFRQFFERHERILSGLEHYRDNPEHVIELIKLMLWTYCILRLREQAKRVTEHSKGTYVRALLTKQILFQHQ
ncbi:uncharacterized protein LOC125944133 [Dermacentor silvarum]|uniref:uncharacterized protein LOC125944133 n=1 Tax=Dermacentor silvarum TaxID=543639 RepID=UPI0021010695|nr:uncharacterized protein LOC125944133 [Dermacentor silvarum]